MQLKHIFQNRNLTLLWAGQMASQSGDSVFQIGLLWLVLELSGSEAITGLVAMSSYLPAVLLSLFAGVAADRFDRRRIMIGADAVRTGCILVIPAAYLCGFLSPLLLAGVAFVLAISMTFFNPARDSMIPQIVPKEGLVRANSLVQTSWQLSLLTGPAIAGMFLYLVGKYHLFTLDALLYLISFLLIILIRVPRREAATIERGTGFREVTGGLRYVFRHPIVLPLLLITVADNLFIMGPAIVGTPVFVKEVLGLGARHYAIVMSCYAIGMLLGTAWMVIYGGRFKKGRLLLVGMVLDGLTYVPLMWVNSLIVMEVTIIIHSLAIPLIMVSRSSLIQAFVPTEYTGRVFALVNLAVVGMSALSAGVSGFLLAAWGAQKLFFYIGIGGAVCGVIGLIFAKELRNNT